MHLHVFLRSPMLPAAMVIAGLVSGCTAIGPETVPRDRFDYNASIADSWKEQTLLNIVKLRYADIPVFVEVSSVVSGYSLESSVNVGAGVATPPGADFLSLGTAGRFTDRPTITYAPITGSRFNKTFMTPIPPSIVLFLIQSGWPADVILSITVDAINGLRGQGATGPTQHESRTGYYRALQLMRELQLSDALGMQLIQEGEGDETTIMFFEREGAGAEVSDKLAEMLSLLQVNPDARQIKVRYGRVPANDSELRMLTRSMLQIMLTIARVMEVPEADLAAGRTVSFRDDSEVRAHEPHYLMDIRHAAERPADAFVAVPYRDAWFYIADGDYQSKRTFAFLMLLFSLTETGSTEGLPLVTIPAG